MNDCGVVYSPPNQSANNRLLLSLLKNNDDNNDDRKQHTFIFQEKKKIESKKDPDLDKNKSLNLRRSYSMESS